MQRREKESCCKNKQSYWGKKEVVEVDVTNIDDDILISTAKRNKRVVEGKKLSQNIHVVPLDNVSSHSDESVLKWKYVFHRRITLERDLSEEGKKVF